MERKTPFRLRYIVTSFIQWLHDLLDLVVSLFFCHLGDLLNINSSNLDSQNKQHFVKHKFNRMLNANPFISRTEMICLSSNFAFLILNLMDVLNMLKPLPLYEDGRHENTPKVKLKHLDRPLVTSCSIGHKPLPPQIHSGGARAELKTLFPKDGFCHFR